MKRPLIPILTLMLTLLTCLTARATTWFPDGQTLHMDPLCPRSDFSLESCFEKTLSMTAGEAQAQSWLICSECHADPAGEAAPSVTWYHNPDGGQALHRDPECATVHAKYKPLTEAEQLPAGMTPDNACTICGGLTASGASPIGYLFDNTVWNSTPEEKAQMLPGIWTLPSENAIPFTEAMGIAKAWAAPYSGKAVHSAIAFHYDTDPRKNPRETWQVVVATTLMHPVCIVQIDALTGEVYGAQLSREYSDQLLSAESLQLAASTAAQAEIIADRVNFRAAPGGDRITRLDAGEVLTLIGEVRRGDELWYAAVSSGHGAGYVLSAWAQPVYERRLRGKDGSPLTENLLACAAGLRRWQLETGYPAGGAVTPDEAMVAMARLMLAHGIVVRSAEADVLTDPAALPEEQTLAARRILLVHYGTSNADFLLTAGGTPLPGIRPEDWHSPEAASSAERAALSALLAGVEEECR